MPTSAIQLNSDQLNATPEVATPQLHRLQLATESLATSSSPVSAGLPRSELTHDSTRTPMPSISSGLVATACASSTSARKPAEREDQRQRVLARAEQERPAEAEQRQADDLQYTGHHQLPGRHHRGGAPDPLLAVDERRRQHRTARHRGGQRVSGVERRLGPPLPHVDSGGAQQGALDLGEAVHRGHRRDDSGQHPPPVRRVAGSSTLWRADRGPAPARRPAR